MIQSLLPTIEKTIRLYAICQNQLSNPNIPIRKKKALIAQISHLEGKLKDLRNKIDKQVNQPLCKVSLIENGVSIEKWFPGFTEIDVKLYYKLIPTETEVIITEIKRIQ